MLWYPHERKHGKFLTVATFHEHVHFHVKTVDLITKQNYLGKGTTVLYLNILYLIL